MSGDSKKVKTSPPDSKVTKTNGGKSWGPVSAVLITVITYIASQVLVGIVFGLFLILSKWDNERIDQWINLSYAQFLFVAGSAVATIGVLWLFLRARKIGFRALGFLRPPEWRDVLSTLGGFFIYFALFILAAVIASQVFGVNTEQEQEIGFDGAKAAGEGLVWVFLSLVVLPPLVEETLFRGFLFGGLRTKLSFVRATLVTSALFAVPHLFASSDGLLWIAAIDTFVLSLVLCHVREKTGALWAPIGIHAIKNCIAFIFIFVV